MQRLLYNLATDRYNGFVAGLMKFLLFIFSCIYGLLVRILILFWRYRPYLLNCKVISVGNITLGGTGKTPLVEYTARYLQERGHKVAVLSRGYKRRAISCQPSAISYEKMGDEPYMLANNLQGIPVIVDIDRIRGARCAVEKYGVDTAILDDGFQQWKIKKDLEVVTIDATNPFGNHHLIPRGILREPLSSLRRADACVLTKSNLNTDTQRLRDLLMSINPKLEIFESIHKPLGFYELGSPHKLFDLNSLENKSAVLFSGIADHDSFEKLITDLGVKAGLHFRFQDHHCYTQEDLNKIAQATNNKDIGIIITTEKDAARLSGLRTTDYGLRILVLRIQLELKNEEGLHNRLLGLYSA